MKLNECDIDIQPEELETINKPDSFKNKIRTDRSEERRVGKECASV